MDKYEKIERWFIDYGDDIYKYLVYFTGVTDVEDLVQDVFVKAMKKHHLFEQKSHPKTWLIAIARNLAIDHMRKRTLQKLISDKILTFIPIKDTTPEERIVLQEDMNELYEQINKLKKNYRDVIILRVIMDLSVSDVGDILDMSSNKVNVYLHRALKILQQKKRKNEGEGGESYELDTGG